MQEFARRPLRTNDRRTTFASDLWDFLKGRQHQPVIAARFTAYGCATSAESSIRTRARLLSFEWRLHRRDDAGRSSRSLADSASSHRLKVRAKHLSPP
jgi:hypothetical protein